MGLGRKANKPEDTSATSTSGDESSCMPASGMAADLSNSALEVRRRSHKVAESTLPKPTCSGLVTRAHHHDASPHFSALPCTRTTAPPSAHLPASLQVAAQFSDVSDNRTQSWERSEVSPAPTCLHPGPALRGAPRGRAHCHTHQLPSRPTGHQRGQVLLGRCTFLAGRGPQPAP